MPVLGVERKVERLGRTHEHVGVWMCWVRVRSEVRRVWKVDGRRMGRVRARDSIVWFLGWGGATDGGRDVCDGGLWAACSYGDRPGDDGDGVAAENTCQDASWLEEVALRWRCLVNSTTFEFMHARLSRLFQRKTTSCATWSVCI